MAAGKKQPGYMSLGSEPWRQYRIDKEHGLFSQGDQSSGADSTSY